MMWFLILLTLSFTASEKLDRTYLPPSGAQFAGGNPDEIHTPFETPSHSKVGLIQENLIPNKFNGVDSTRQSIQLPVTTTSYAFSQTTTYPPAESYESSTMPNLNPNFVTGIPVQNVGQLSPLQYHPELPFNIKNQQVDAYSSNNQPGLLDQHIISPNGEINIGGSIFNPHGFKSDLQNYPVGQVINRDPNQISNPFIETVQSVSQVQNTIPYPDRQNGLTRQGTSNISDQSMIINDRNNLDHSNKLNPTQQLHPEPENQAKQDFGSIPNLSSALVVSLRNPVYHSDRPQATGDRNAVILKYDNIRSPNGYSYSFETSNGIRADESGVIDDGTKAHGSYSYIGDDGKLYSVYYTADENGFQPHGDHLPTPPPVPDAIKKVIEEAAMDEAAGIIDDGSYDEKKYGNRNDLNSRNMLRNKLQYSKTTLITAINDEDNSDTKILYPLRENNSISDIGYNNKRLDDKSAYSSQLKEDSKFEGAPELFSNVLPITAENNEYNSNNRKPININDITLQYPGSINIDRKVDNFNHQGGPEPVYNYSINQNGLSNSGQGPKHAYDMFSKISDGRHTEEQKPMNKNFADFVNIYSNENKPRIDDIFNEKNVDDFDSKRINIPSFTNFSKNNNNKQPLNHESIQQVGEDEYYYNSPRNGFKDTAYPTRFKDEEIPSILESTYNTTTSRPFLAPERHVQPSTHRQYSESPSNGPQLFTTSRVSTPIDEYNNDNNYNSYHDFVIKGEKSDNGPIQSTHNIIPSYSQVISTTISPPPPEFGNNDIPLKYTKFQQTQKPNTIKETDYNLTSQSPERYDFETIHNNKNYNIQEPVDYSVGGNIPFISDRPETSPVGTYSEGLNRPNYAFSILSSTPFKTIFPLDSVSKSPQTSKSGYQYKPPKSFFSTTELPSTIGTTPNLFLPSTQSSRLPQVYSTTTQYTPTYSSTPVTDQQHVINGFGNPVTSDLLTVIPSLVEVNIPNRDMIDVSDEINLNNHKVKALDTIRPLGDSEDKLSPAHNIIKSHKLLDLLGKNFSGPVQPQRFDTQTGYHYK